MSLLHFHNWKLQTVKQTAFTSGNPSGQSNSSLIRQQPCSLYISLRTHIPRDQPGSTHPEYVALPQHPLRQKTRRSLDLGGLYKSKYRVQKEGSPNGIYASSLGREPHIQAFLTSNAAPNVPLTGLGTTGWIAQLQPLPPRSSHTKAREENTCNVKVGQLKPLGAHSSDKTNLHALAHQCTIIVFICTSSASKHIVDAP